MRLSYENEGPIAKVGMDRPQEKNALDPQIMLDLHRAWQDISADDTLRVAILYSNLPDIFCAGMDLKTAIPVLTRAREPETEAERWLAQVGPHVGESMLKPNIVTKPVIAAINGYCLTGGFEMVMGADLRVASEDAIFQMREASLGIMPTGGSNAYLPRMLTPCRGLEILLTANNFSAKTMYEWGFLNRLVAKREDLMGAAMELATRIAGNGPLAIQGIIRCYRESRDLSWADAFKKELEIGGPVFGSQDAREGIKAQREKRKPNFPGKY
jgi:enoyl-CoA hydratase